MELIADRGLGSVCEAKPKLRVGINVINGMVPCPAVAKAHGMECAPLEL
ncbi:MAG: hypothetical protein P8M70_14760 [Verrucomicrobiota bacterium]|nr:hypothetical protein [Verrucomicrobiota bacterium]